jgi:hypothetical protein
MFCPDCGHEVDEANYCPECGNELNPLVDRSHEPDPGFCRACGTEVGDARFCPECGERAAQTRARRQRSRPKAARGPASSQAAGKPTVRSRPAGRAAVREQKRSQFTSPRRKKTRMYAFGMIAVVVLTGVVSLFLMNGGGGDATAATQTVAIDGNVRIPVADLASGSAKYYTYDAGGVSVKYLAVKGTDGTYRTALDACNVCYASKKGYRQEGSDLVCNNCGTKVALTSISVLTGDCNPVPIKNKLKGDSLVVKSAALDGGVKYFQ